MNTPVVPPSTFQIVLWWLQYVSPFLQVLILAITGLIIWRYTKETQRLREEAQRQVEAIQRQTEVFQQQVKTSQEQVKVTQEQIEVSQRPFVVIDPQWHEGRLRTFRLRNIGNSAAVNVEIVHGPQRTKTSIVENGEPVNIQVQEDNMRSMEMFAQLHDLDINTEPIFFLDATSISKGVLLKIEYCNVAMMQYSTTERISQNGIVIEPAGTGKMGPYVQNR